MIDPGLIGSRILLIVSRMRPLPGLIEGRVRVIVSRMRPLWIDKLLIRTILIWIETRDYV